MLDLRSDEQLMLAAADGDDQIRESVRAMLTPSEAAASSPKVSARNARPLEASMIQLSAIGGAASQT